MFLLPFFGKAKTFLQALWSRCWHAQVKRILIKLSEKNFVSPLLCPIYAPLYVYNLFFFSVYSLQLRKQKAGNLFTLLIHFYTMPSCIVCVYMLGFCDNVVYAFLLYSIWIKVYTYTWLMQHAEIIFILEEIFN